MEKGLEPLWQKAAAFHGHVCPGLAIGFKACEAAMKVMGVTGSKDEELVCITENDACGVDAIQAVLGCSLGKGNLLYRNIRKISLYIYPAQIPEEQMRFYMKKRNPGMEKEEYYQYLLECPVEEVFDYKETQVQLPERARIFRNVTCEICGEDAPEHRMRLQDGKKVCMDCFKEYTRGW